MVMDHTQGHSWNANQQMKGHVQPRAAPCSPMQPPSPPVRDLSPVRHDPVGVLCSEHSRLPKLLPRGDFRPGRTFPTKVPQYGHFPHQGSSIWALSPPRLLNMGTFEDLHKDQPAIDTCTVLLQGMHQDP